MTLKYMLDRVLNSVNVDGLRARGLILVELDPNTGELSQELSKFIKEETFFNGTTLATVLRDVYDDFDWIYYRESNTMRRLTDTVVNSLTMGYNSLEEIIEAMINLIVNGDDLRLQGRLRAQAFDTYTEDALFDVQAFTEAFLSAYVINVNYKSRLVEHSMVDDILMAVQRKANRSLFTILDSEPLTKLRANSILTVIYLQALVIYDLHLNQKQNSAIW